MLSHICCPTRSWALVRPAVVAQAWRHTGPRHRDWHRSAQSCRSACGTVRTQAAAAAAAHTTKSMAVVEGTKLVPLELIFGNARYRAPQISPSGKQLAFLGPSQTDVLNVWTRSIEDGADEKVLTNDTHRGIRDYQWSEDGKFILYMQDVGGDENWHLYAQPLDGGEARDLTPYEGVRAQGIYTDKHHPGQVLVGLNKRDAKVFDMQRITIASGESDLDTENPGNVSSWLTDADFKIRGCVAVNNSNGDQTLRVRDSADPDAWRDLIRWPQEEDGGPVSFAKEGDSMYVRTSLGSDTTRLARVSCSDGSQILEEVAQNPRCDVGGILVDEDTHAVFAVAFNYLRREWLTVDPQYKEDFEVLSKAAPGDFGISSRSADNQTWIASYNQARGPIAHYLYSRATKQARLLFVDRPGLQGYQLADMEGLIVKARDGEDIPCYLSLPPSQKREDKPGLPTVLLVHGGPWARDVWGFHPYVAWLTNRGYAVLQCNFRGSTGYGKRWLHLGDKQWGIGTMQHDLSDVVAWAIEEGIADGAKVAIMGGSYGGYATLAGLTYTPDLYCCGVDIVGPSHIKTLLQTIPAYWAPMRKMLDLRIGEALEDDDWNRKISPLYHIDNIRVPLIIAQGANDPRVKQAESDQIYKAMKAKGLPVEYLLYEDEGHGFARPPNSLDFCSRTDQFLATHLGGRAQPLIEPKGSSVKVISQGH